MPPVEGCRWCGTPAREHGQRWVPGRGWHGYAVPSPAQIEARMRASRLPRTPHVCTPNLNCEHQKSEDEE